MVESFARAFNTALSVSFNLRFTLPKDRSVVNASTSPPTSHPKLLVIVLTKESASFAVVAVLCTST